MSPSAGKRSRPTESEPAPPRRSARIHALELAGRRSRLTESEPAPPRRSARIHALELARSQSKQAEDRADPALSTRVRRHSKADAFVPPSHEDKFLRLRESLLPGISNDIVLRKIATLLPLETLRILSLVGPDWRQAMEDRLVYDARVLANSGDSCVVISFTKSSCFQDVHFAPAIYVYSLRSHACYHLPPIPQVASGFPYDCECIALDGRVYVLGGRKKNGRTSQQICIKDVYVLDLAAPRQWKVCAKMRDARANFKCGAIGGKIYAFGGIWEREWVTEAEVYDPRTNSWSVTTPFRRWSSTNGSKIDGPTQYELTKSHSTDGNNVFVVTQGQGGLFRLTALFPGQEKWRTLSENFPPLHDRRNSFEILVEGKLYSVSLDDIYVYDVEEKKWTKRYSCVSNFSPYDRHFIWGISAAALDKEVVLVVKGIFTHLSRYFLRSIGFGSDVNEIAWEHLRYSFPIGIEYSSGHVLKF